MALLVVETPTSALGLSEDRERYGEATYPTLEIVGGTVNLYMSNNDYDDAPDFANMTPIINGQGVSGDMEVTGRFRWIAYEENTRDNAGVAIQVKECGVTK